MLTILEDNTVVSGIISVLGVVWTVFGLQDRITAYLTRKKGERKATAILALAAGIEKVYDEYVKALKDGRADGKLTKAEIASARARALTAAKLFAESQGVDIVTELGKDYLNVWLEEVLRRVRNEGKSDVGLSGLIGIVGYGPKSKITG